MKEIELLVKQFIQSDGIHVRIGKVLLRTAGLLGCLLSLLGGRWHQQ